MKIFLKVHKDNNRIRFSITDKTILENLKEQVKHGDLVKVEFIEVIKKEDILKDIMSAQNE